MAMPPPSAPSVAPSPWSMPSDMASVAGAAVPSVTVKAPTIPAASWPATVQCHS